VKQPQIRSIIPHFVQGEHAQSLPDRIADLHAQIIESRLRHLELTTAQKLTVIDQILANLKSGEVHNAVNQ
jgi:hypothetical protein